MKKNILMMAFASAFLSFVPALAAKGSTDQMSRGEYLSRAGDCTACHTSPAGETFAGGVPLASPIGMIYSTNITPDKTHGIGNYSLEDFNKAVRQGQAKDGHYLYPAMPFTAYAKVSDEDMKALYNYFMNEVKPVATANKPTDIAAPMNMRWPLGIWTGLFHDNTLFKPDPQQSAEWNRGAYLVQGLAHCGTCHTPRNIAMQEKGLTEASSEYLSGAYLDGWYAPTLRGMSFSDADLLKLLQDGHGEKLSFSGPMAEAVTQSLQYLTEDDHKSMIVYLRSLSAPVQTAGATVALPDTVRESGQATYAMYCSTCHGVTGQGVPYVVPALENNHRFNTTTTNAVNVILWGAQTPVTVGQPSYHMPAYADILNDQEIAAVTSYIATSWGNHGQMVSAAEVVKIKAGTKPLSVALVVGGMAGGGLVFLILLRLLYKRVFRRKASRKFGGFE